MTTDQIARTKQIVRMERYRRKYLPVQLEATRRKVAMLENEARRLGMDELLKEGSITC